MTAMTAGEMTEMLRRAYLPENRPAAGVFCPEIGAPDGRRRADVIWAPLTMAGGGGLVGHEIKVSRADVVHELEDHTKAESWAQYCDRWWLTVSDPALVEGLDVPDAWGIMSPPSGRRKRAMTVLRPAPMLHPMEPAIAVRRVLSWYHHHVGTAVDSSRREIEWREREIERNRATIDELRLSGGKHVSPHVKQINDIQRRVKKLLQERRSWGDATDEDIAVAIADITQARELTQDLVRQASRMVTEAQALAEPFKRQIPALEALAGGLS